MCLEWGRKRGRPARSSLFAMFQGEKLVRQEIATFPVLRRVGNMDDGKTNVQFLGRAAHLKLDQLVNVFINTHTRLNDLPVRFVVNALG